MATSTRRLLRSIATRSVVAALPVAMMGAYASGIFLQPPGLTAAEIELVAEISASPTTVGVAVSPLYGQTRAQIDEQLDDMLAIGVTNIRVFVPWGLIEIADDTYYWDMIDDVMEAAQARNMGVLAEINATAAFAGPNPVNPFPLGNEPPDPAKFAEFAGAFADRWGDVVSAYEIWNEPNSVQFYDPISPEGYAALIKAAYPVLKGIDATATVVAGAVGTVQSSAWTLNTVEFVTRMLAVPGAAAAFDALSVHPYSQEIPFSGTCPTCAPGLLTPREQVEALMALGGLAGKKFWITEYGVPTYTPLPPNLQTPAPPPITPTQQAAWVMDLLNYWDTYGDRAGPIFLYTGRDSVTAVPFLDEGNFGLWYSNGSEKPIIEQLRDWLDNPTDPTDPGTPGNPIAQFLQALVQQIQQFVQAIVQAITNFLAALGGQAPTAVSTAVGPDPADVSGFAASRLVSLSASTDAVDASGALAAGEVEDADAPPAPATAEPDATVPVAEEPVVEEPVAEVPVAEEPVVEEPAVEEQDADPVEPAEVPEPGADSSSGNTVDPDPSPSTTDPAPSQSDSTSADEEGATGDSGFTSSSRADDDASTATKSSSPSSDNSNPAGTPGRAKAAAKAGAGDASESSGASSDSADSGSDD